MEFVFETRTTMKSFANSLSKDLFFKGLSFRHIFQDLKTHLKSVFQMTFQKHSANYY